MRLAILGSILALAIAAPLAWSQNAAPSDDEPADEAGRLAEDFDSLFNPTPGEPTEPRAPAQLGPAPSTDATEALPADTPQARMQNAPARRDEGDATTVSSDLRSDNEGEAADALVPMRWTQYETATLRGLDKITGRFTDIAAEIGTPVTFGTLSVAVQTCYQTPPDLPPESAAFIQVRAQKPMEAQAGLEAEELLFSGWMFASSPGLNALEHPVYDVWVIECARVEIPTGPGR